MSIRRGDNCDCGCDHDSMDMSMSVGKNIKWVGLSGDYNELKHRPSIEGILLQGNLDLEDFGALNKRQIIDLIHKWACKHHVNFMTREEIEQVVNDVNEATGVSHLTIEDVEAAIAAHGYQTADDVQAAIDALDFVTEEQMNSTIQTMLDDISDVGEANIDNIFDQVYG